MWARPISVRVLVLNDPAARAMSHYNDKLNLKLNPAEIKDLFNRADADSDGTISYEEFVRFAGAGKRFIPEFLKPKARGIFKTSTQLDDMFRQTFSARRLHENSP